MIWILLVGLLLLGLAGFVWWYLKDDYHPFPVILGIRFNGYFLGYIWMWMCILGGLLALVGLVGFCIDRLWSESWS